MKAQKKPLGSTVNFSLLEGDALRLREVSERLSLSRSEIARRALRLGMAQLEEVKLPGGSLREQKAGASRG